MIRINQIKLRPEENEALVFEKAKKKLKVDSSQVILMEISRKSIDARKKDDIKVVYSVDVQLKNEASHMKKIKDRNILLVQKKSYNYIPTGKKSLKHRPIIIGSGPAGLFCALYLAKNNFSPIVLERGESIENRTTTVEKFWKDNILDTESNAQFGEGGAGTFSDGKLNTAVNDKYGRNTEVLKTFVRYGAPDSILYESKPHIGTDLLKEIIVNIRKEIERLGGSVFFRSKVTDLKIEQNQLIAVEINEKEILPCDCAVLAIGHSARDTFEMLEHKNIQMQAKPFAIGVRVQHPQAMINKSQYGEKYANAFGAASYKVTAKASDGKGVYSFCMCPGGYVVNASSEQNRIAVNGMSYHNRKGENANSAIIVTVTPDDYGNHTLDGMYFQRELEQRAYNEGKGKIPVQLFRDFLENQISSSFQEVKPAIKGQYAFANLRKVLPDFMSKDLIEGMHKFGKQIQGFDRGDCILAGIESRTSSPVRIIRDETFMSNIKGLYPCGEGAGYAGGITSAAMDGLKVYEAITQEYGDSLKLNNDNSLHM